MNTPAAAAPARRARLAAMLAASALTSPWAVAPAIAQDAGATLHHRHRTAPLRSAGGCADVGRRSTRKRRAVGAYGSCQSVPVMLAGHADRSDTATCNVGLSQRRNASVRSYLTGRGIPDGNITSQAFGESRNRVPTADGVRELPNRRVEITYGPGPGI